jgi:hypothetical protein
MGWINDLGNVYEKNVIEEQIVRGSVAPQTDHNLSYRNNKLGLEVPNLAADSLAGNVRFGNPHEQEETKVKSNDALIKELDLLEKDLNPANTNDRVALMVLGKLRQKFQ